MKLDVYVPVEGTPASLLVLPGSAIVGTVLPAGLVRIDYEGNRYGAPSLAEYAGRLLHAAGRHEHDYPTTARAFVPPDELVQVGVYDTETHQLEVEDFDPLADWLAVEGGSTPGLSWVGDQAGVYQIHRP